MKRIVRSNPKCLSIFATAFILAVALLFQVQPADARTRHRAARGFEPTDRVLECIRGPWNGDSMESGGNYAAVSSSGKYRGAYQSDRAFEVAYAINLIPPEHWWLWGSHTWDRADKWAPAIQDEMGKNAIRARGLQPWPTPRRRCVGL